MRSRSMPTQNARSRLPLSLAWRRLDGVGVAVDRTDLIYGRLAAPINETASSLSATASPGSTRTMTGW